MSPLPVYPFFFLFHVFSPFLRSFLSMISLPRFFPSLFPFYVLLPLSLPLFFPFYVLPPSLHSFVLSFLFQLFLSLFPFFLLSILFSPSIVIYPPFLLSFLSSRSLLRKLLPPPTRYSFPLLLHCIDLLVSLSHYRSVFLLHSLSTSQSLLYLYFSLSPSHSLASTLFCVWTLSTYFVTTFSILFSSSFSLSFSFTTLSLCFVYTSPTPSAYTLFSSPSLCLKFLPLPISHTGLLLELVKCPSNYFLVFI